MTGVQTCALPIWLTSEVFGYGGEVRVLTPERIAKNISEIATKRLGEI